MIRFCMYSDRVLRHQNFFNITGGLRKVTTIQKRLDFQNTVSKSSDFLCEKILTLDCKELSKDSDLIAQIENEYENTQQDENFQKTTEFCKKMFEQRIRDHKNLK